MHVARHPAVYLIGALTVALVCTLRVTPAVSGPPTADEKLLACAGRVKALEAEVGALRDELRASTGRDCRSPSTFTRATRLSRNGPSTEVRPSKRGHCDPSYDYDEQGRKRYKPECLDSGSAPACSTPFEFSNGIKSVKPACLDSAPASPCDPPYRFESRVKVFKEECL